jgi:hypothetical protein
VSSVAISHPPSLRPTAETRVGSTVGGALPEVPTTLDSRMSSEFCRQSHTGRVMTVTSTGSFLPALTGRSFLARMTDYHSTFTPPTAFQGLPLMPRPHENQQSLQSRSHAPPIFVAQSCISTSTQHKPAGFQKNRLEVVLPQGLAGG